MPYFQRNWIQTLGRPALKQTRTCAVGNEEASDQLFKNEPLPIYETVPMTIQKMNDKQEELKKAVESYIGQPGADLIKDSQTFPQFITNKEEIVFKGYYSNIYGCKNSHVEAGPLMCRIFERGSGIDPACDLYIKTLRHVGKRNNFCIATHGIFVDDARRIHLFQELAGFGNALDYVRQGQVVTEPMMHDWAMCLWSAMDFLGDIGISHRAIVPKHVKLKAKEKRIVAKLSGFRSAVVYWEPAEQRPVELPCLPLEKRQYATFQAPEVYGRESDVFDPIAADVWSYGATLFYLVARLYPFNPRTPDPSLDLEIRNAIATSNTISDPCKYFIYACLRSHTSYRAPFDAISQDPWFRNLEG